MIRNTTADMNDPSSGDRDLLLALGLTTGSANEFIEGQEKAGQSQLVHSNQLPTDVLHGTDADFEALGFTFGDPDPADPMFRPATLPDGWVKQGSDHAMWSYIVDQLGRKRAGVFYKAAFYDRSAHLELTSVYSYVQDAAFHGTELIPDDIWATPEAITREARAAIEWCDKYIAMYSGERYSADGFGARKVAEQTEERARYEAMVARFGTTASQACAGGAPA
jgi:hypothetical protein